MTKPDRVSNERGFSFTELTVVIALIGVITVMAVPNLLSYWRAAKVSAGAEELAAVLNRGRQLAIRQNTSMCVEVTGTNVRMRTGSCAGTIWTGGGTDASGVIRLANDVRVGGGPTALFSNAGGASAQVTYTVTDPIANRTRNVVVTTTGRVSIQ
jgi:prepilin-type N-terminal cleavage/methylation domain-containing protein